MVNSNTTLTAGMTISISGQLYRVETAVKVTVPKGTPFIKAKLRNLQSQELIEKTFKPNQTVQEVVLVERALEFLYPEEGGYLFLDIHSLEQCLIPASVIAQKSNYLKEGVEVQAQFYGDVVSLVELPQFLELKINKVADVLDQNVLANATKRAILETGAEINVPLFIDVGDVIRVDTRTNEYIQRV